MHWNLSLDDLIFRKFAKQLVKDGEEAAYQSAIEENYLAEKDRMPGSEAHYNFFESLISGRDLNSQEQTAGDNFRRIFPAQVLKDCAMASRIRRVLESAGEEDKCLVIAGLGHLEHGFGVPERVERHNMMAEDQSCIITVRDIADLDTDQPLEGLGKVDVFEVQYPGDYILLYEDPPEESDVKEEISAAYDKVAETAKLEGWLSQNTTNWKFLNKIVVRRQSAGREGDDEAGLHPRHDRYCWT